MRQPAVIDSGYGTLRPFGFASLLFNRFAFISDFLNIYSIIIVFSPANVNRFWHVFHFCYIFPSYFPWCRSADVCLCKMHGKCRKNARLRRFSFEAVAVESSQCFSFHDLIRYNPFFFRQHFFTGIRFLRCLFLLPRLDPLKQTVHRRLCDLIHCIRNGSQAWDHII